ncbi:MAG: hemerythrin family protein [Nitrospinae bacterium]|nr:hemerythrin family protein [Nitrospinota bacterium]
MDPRSAAMMPKLEWDEIFSTGIERFDSQHKVLFGFLNVLRANALGKRDKEVVNEVTDSLLTYTMTHFLEEEITLCRLEYPGYADHKAEHDQFLIAARDLYIRFKAGKSESRIIAAEIITVVSEWLQGHILVKDKAYGEFLLQKGFTPDMVK